MGASQFSAKSSRSSSLSKFFSFSLAALEWCSSTILSSPTYFLISSAFCSIIASSGMTKNMRFLSCLAQCARAYLREETVFPPPVGTFSLNIPPSLSANALHCFDMSLRTMFRGVSAAKLRIFFSVLSKQLLQTPASAFSTLRFAPFTNSAVSLLSPSITADRSSLASILI